MLNNCTNHCFDQPTKSDQSVQIVCFDHYFRVTQACILDEQYLSGRWIQQPNPALVSLFNILLQGGAGGLAAGLG